MAGKTLGGLAGSKEGDLPRAETMALLEAIRRRQEHAQRAAATRARNKAARERD